MINTILLVIILIILSLLVWRDYQRHATYINLDKVIHGLAGRLLELYADDLRVLGEASTKEYSRKQYLQLHTDYGFPIGQADAVCNAVWLIIADAQGKQPERSKMEVLLYG